MCILPLPRFVVGFGGAVVGFEVSGFALVDVYIEFCRDCRVELLACEELEFGTLALGEEKVVETAPDEVYDLVFPGALLDKKERRYFSSA